MRQYHTCTAHVCILCQNTHSLTLPMASAMDSTMPPTIPPSLAASFKVTIMSSTASFINWAASEMASWVWDAWGHSQLINVSVTRLVPGGRKCISLKTAPESPCSWLILSQADMSLVWILSAVRAYTAQIQGWEDDFGKVAGYRLLVTLFKM